MMVKSLDLATLKDALYVTSPTGLRQLTAHLEQRGVEVSAPLLEQLLTGLMREQKVQHRTVRIGSDDVGLYGLSGHWSG